MKDYPRIRRLSTLGIIRHQHFDYEFNAFRTDFVGEGGAGKSMISDLLQLICIGTKFFRSPTKGQGPRKPNTLVLRTEGKGTDMGYAFLNIEIERQQYVVIGIYLESSGASDMFIVQAGNDFSVETILLPFSNLLGVNDFQKDNYILPLEDLKNHIHDTLQLTCESWDRTQNYHKILFKNDILPLDLSASNRALENYAKIIQAFSRESLDIDKSNSLQSFLFGDEKEKEFSERFDAAVEEMKGDEKQYVDNRGEIDKLTQKQKELSDLLHLKNEKEENLRCYLRGDYDYQHHNQVELVNLIEQAIKNYRVSLELLPKLKSIVNDKLDLFVSKKIDIESKVKNRSSDVLQWDIKNSRRNKFLDCMNSLKLSADEIVEMFNRFQVSKQSLLRIGQIENLFKAKGLPTSLLKNYLDKNIIGQLEEKLSQLNLNLDVKKKLRSLNNVNDKHSLARWALESGQQFNQKQEAIIRKFQNNEIHVQEPIDSNKRYIPFPEILIQKSLDIFKEDDSGFWLSLNGVLEFFSTDFQPIFDTEDKEIIRTYFETQTNTIAGDISKLEQEIGEIILIKDIFEEFTDPDGYLEAWNHSYDLKDQLYSHEVLEMSREEFSDHYNLSQEDRFEEMYQESQLQYKIIKDQERNIVLTESNLKELLDNFLKPNCDKRIDQISSKWKIISKNDVGHTEFNLLVEDGVTTAELREWYTTLKSNYQQLDAIIEWDLRAEELNDKKNKIYAQYPELFQTGYQSESSTKEIVDSLLAKYNKAENSYIILYNTIVNEQITNSKERYFDSGDFDGLCGAILPAEVLNSIDILEKEVIEKIRSHLASINLKNKKLNERKLKKLVNIINDVGQEVSEQLNKSRIIRNFLNDDEKKITGGHKVSLDLDYDNCLSAEWMQFFIDSIQKDMEYGGQNSLFESERGLSNDLEKYSSLAEKLREAYYRSGGNRSLKPQIKELLNPKSYYGLKFSMRTAKGKRNDGSTSQTYAAIALLCMGKLSLIDKKATKQKKAIRFMAIDEAAGLGSNFDMLYKIAELNDYQLLSLSISPNKIDARKQNIYLLLNSVEDEEINYDPVPIFGSADNV